MTPPNQRLLHLLDSWHEARQTNPSLSLEAFCAGCPELLDPARQALANVHRIEQLADLDTPVSDTANTRSYSGHTSSPLMSDPPAIAGYEILGLLGKGGMGAVYQARDTRLKREVALKVIREGMADARTMDRFQAEAETIARLNHPHIVQIYEVGSWQTREGLRLPYLALEFVAGGTLESRLSNQPVPPQEAARLLTIVARAVRAAHDAGIVHRDLKPGNILLGPHVEGSNGNSVFGWPKVTDFGLARRREPGAGSGMTQSGMVVGTPAYMSPEQAEGDREVGPPADVWAMGVILYRLLTGKQIFEARSTVDLLHKICHDTPVPLRKICGEVPAHLEAVCLDCLNRDPAKRPTSGELARRLMSSGEGETAAYEPVRAVPSRRLLLGLAAASGVPLALGLGWWFWPRGSADTGGQGKPKTLPPFKGFIDAEMTRPGDPTRQLLALRDPAARPLQAGDEVRVEVKLNRPGYPYVLWIDAKGGVLPAYPWVKWNWDNRGEEKPVSSLKLPWQDGKWWWWEMADGPMGLETMLLLVREEPLPAEVDLKRALAGLGAQPAMDKVGLAVAWFENGKLVRDEVERAPKLGVVKEGSSPLERVNREVQTRVGEHFDYTRAVTFTNRGSKQAGE